MAVCGICLIHTRYFFAGRYYSSLSVNITPLCGYGATCVWNLRAFIIPLIPAGSPHPPPPLPTGEPGYEARCALSLIDLMKKAFLEKTVVELVYKFDEKSYHECLKR